jgi:ribosomal protein L21E
MKLLKKNTENTKTINEAFKVGQTVKWTVGRFDGRATEFKTRTGTVVKVNRKTVDVETPKGNVYRLDAFIKVTTGEWAVQ